MPASALDHDADLLDVFNCLSVGLAQIPHAKLIVRDHDRGEVTFSKQPLRGHDELRMRTGGLCLTWCGREFDITSERWTKRNQLTVTEIVNKSTSIGIGVWVSETKFSADVGDSTKAFVREFLVWISEQPARSAHQAYCVR